MRGGALLAPVVHLRGARPGGKHFCITLLHTALQCGSPCARVRLASPECAASRTLALEHLGRNKVENGAFCKECTGHNLDHTHMAQS